MTPLGTRALEMETWRLAADHAVRRTAWTGQRPSPHHDAGRGNVRRAAGADWVFYVNRLPGVGSKGEIRDKAKQIEHIRTDTDTCTLFEE